MILTCPECATSYFVDDARVPAQGRRVRCSSCGHRWTAGPDGPIPDVPVSEAAPPPPPEPEPPAVPAPADLEIVAVEEPPPLPPPLRRPAASSRRPVRAERPGGALVWAGLAALVVALIAGVLIFREQVVRLWPSSSAAYAGLGFDLRGAGLVLEQVQVKPAFLAGRPVLAVTGAIRNLRDVPVEAPPVRLTLLNRAGQPVAAKIARPADATIPGGAKRHFSVTLLDPPATARELEVRFESGARKKAARATAVVSPAPAAPPPGPRIVGDEHPIDATPAAPAELSPAAATEHG
jgi:predicted Zn finger-like uncharacterized protein